ncbi:hypothetical protein CDD83_7971 [Cordyceps sp. RAO-2017]|nr:hypothetical protein CDD83_7971 [Cordyceps sp. RAO-2017]
MIQSILELDRRDEDLHSSWRGEAFVGCRVPRWTAKLSRRPEDPNLQVPRFAPPPLTPSAALFAVTMPLDSTAKQARSRATASCAVWNRILMQPPGRRAGSRHRPPDAKPIVHGDMSVFPSCGPHRRLLNSHHGCPSYKAGQRLCSPLSPFQYPRALLSASASLLSPSTLLSLCCLSLGLCCSSPSKPRPLRLISFSPKASTADPLASFRCRYPSDAPPGNRRAPRYTDLASRRALRFDRYLGRQSMLLFSLSHPPLPLALRSHPVLLVVSACG